MKPTFGKHTISPTFITLIALGMLTAPLAAPLRADLSDYTKINVSDIEDITLDATYRGLFFRVEGKSYYYNHPVGNQPVAIADFIELLGKAQSLLVIENKNQTTNYYDGRTAVQLERILLKFGKAQNLAD